MPSSPEAVSEPNKKPTVPDYALLRRIGGGAYGEVWLARSLATGVMRAAKIVWRDKFEDDRPFRREFEGIQHFEQISREHASQLALFHIGRNDPQGYFYYVMELADDAAEGQKADGGGQNDVAARSASTVSNSNLQPSTFESYKPHTLRAELERGRLSASRVLEVGLALAEALSHLHRNGLVHRDVKPSNVIFVNGRPKLADIGLVTDASDQCSIVGTEGYLPPEGPGSPQADIFALGKVLYEAATGSDRREFPKLPDGLPAWPDARQVFEINEILLKACASDARARYANADAMLAELRVLASGKSVKTKRAQQWYGAMARRAVVLLLTVGSLAAILSVLLRGRPPVDSASDGRDLTNPDGPDSLVSRDATELCDKALAAIRNDFYQEFGEAYTNFQRAIELDPNFARPYVGLLEFKIRDPDTVTNVSLDELSKKLDELAPNLPATAVAHEVLRFYNWDYEGAERYAKQAIKANPRYEFAHTYYAFMLARWDRPEESLAQSNMSRTNGPPKAIILKAIGHAYFVQRDFKRAIDYYQQAIDRHSQDLGNFGFKARAQWAMRDYLRSLDTYEQADHLSGKDHTTVSNRYAYLRQLVTDGGTAAFWEAAKTNRQFASSPYSQAVIHMYLGETNPALERLEASYQAKEFCGTSDAGLGCLLFDEAWDPLRNHRQFTNLLDRVGYTKVMRPRKK